MIEAGTIQLFRAAISERRTTMKEATEMLKSIARNNQLTDAERLELMDVFSERYPQATRKKLTTAMRALQ